MGILGGPSEEERAQQRSQADLGNTIGGIAGRAQDFTEAQQAKVNPFATQRLAQGLPFFNALTDFQGGINARAFAPERANLSRRLAGAGDLPSGFREQSLADFEARRAQGFDRNLVGAMSANDQAKQQAASLLLGQAQIANPLGYFTGASQANVGLLGNPLQQGGGPGGILGGILGGAASFL